MAAASKMSPSPATTGLAVAGLGLGLYLATRAARAAHRRAARRCAASQFEYHCAVYAPDCPATSETGWLLVKVPKSAEPAALREAAAKAMGLADAEKEALQLFPVQRGAGRARLGSDVLAGAGVAGFEALLLARPSDELQLIELVSGRGGVAPLEALAPPPRFPEPGVALPFIGHVYHLHGPNEVVHYNIARSVFPCGAVAYPYGATVRSYSGGVKSKIDDFPDGTQFHPEAEVYQIWSADARLAEEMIARSAEFPKLWNRPLQKKLQDFTGNGLFTSSETSEDWQSGHSVLPRGFNQIKVKSFAPQILSKTRAFIKEWSSVQAGHLMEDVNHWLTAMTADAVVTCSMGLDMRNVERMGAGEPPHPFVDSFRFGLGYIGGSITAKSEYGLLRFLPFFGATRRLEERYAACKETLQELIEGMVAETRRGELGGQNSVIRSMLEDRASSGKYVRYGVLYGHIINLMIAGHETTAATLGFTMQLLAEHPECEAKALAEVRRVLQGRTEPEADDVPKLQYVEQCFREALRLYSPVTNLSRDVAHDTLLRGHAVFQGERISMITRALHTNPEYWGGEFGDPLSFDPERFAPEAVAARHQNAFSPWGFGNRACIGSQFALFEAKTFLASMLLHFKWVAVPGYQLKASLEAGGAAPSPHKLAFHIYPRSGGPCCAPDGSMKVLSALEAPLAVPVPQAAPQQPPVTPQAAPQVNGSHKAGPVMKVLYGSNSGASQEFAAQVASAARQLGFAASTSSLDAALEGGAVEVDGRVAVVVTSTYNGNPPDNAKKFKAWLQEQNPGSLAGLRFAVFGVGNSQWHTYQQFPKEVDAGLARCGATRLFDLGACDVDGASFDSDFEEWLAALMRAIGGKSAPASPTNGAGHAEDGDQEFVIKTKGEAEGKLYSDSKELFKDFHSDKRRILGEGYEFRLQVIEAVEASRELCQEVQEGRSVRHVTLRLEGKAEYRAGDHLEVVPPNQPELVSLAVEALALDMSAQVLWTPSKGGNRIKGQTSDWQQDESARAKMPSYLCTAELFFTWVPDLAGVPSRKVLGWMACKLADEDARSELGALASDAKQYSEKVAAPRLSLVEVLQRYKGGWRMSLGEFAANVKSIQARYYSISSSPAGTEDKKQVTLSVGQVSFSTGTGRLHKGLASSALAELQPGDVILGSLRQLSSGFHVPEDLSAPMIMVGPGTGVAPMMGFLQERAALLKNGKKLGQAVLFFGCRKTSQDYLYREELQGHLQTGALSQLHVAASREGPSKVYVQDLIWEQRETVWQLLQHPKAAIYVCGDARAMAPDVKKAFQRVAEHCGGRSGARAADMVAAMVEGGRYLEDVWAA